MVGGALQVWPIGLALTLAPAPPEPGGAAEPKSPLSWEAPEECPDAHALQVDVERLLGRPIDAADLAPIAVDGRIERRGTAWHLRLEIGGAKAKELEAPRCETLAEVAALYVALAIDPMAMLEAEATPRLPASRDYEGTTELSWPEARGEAGPEAPLVAARKRARGLRIGARFMAGAGGFLLPGAAAGVAAGVSVMFPRARFEALGSYFVPTEAEHDEEPEVGAEIQLGAAALRGCPVLRVQRWEFPLCAGVEVGAMVARGLGVEQPKVRRSVWVAGTLGAAAAWQPARVIALWAQVDAVVTLVRPAFGVNGLDFGFRAPAAGVQGFLGLEARFR
jgi:hypothetical protein